ncbi:conserved exported hypothetical protein [Hyella patelloides LEGE 07179]|uniref:PEP-CTERM sorting domain-containing protein n=1 Tax=Hyella patelloides LEGE 07179 TaxID=945734 RepID=A0A563VPG3_9CYAN|nr:choice-of-anchor L domain-containing protein [Hyella patelloides]VEP13269.1 conserved exported hypothetical protein [Hyella patelloides LEGE 07179]
MKNLLRYVSQASILGISLTVGLAGNANALTITPTNDGTALTNSILGQGITVTPGSIIYTGADGAAGFFSDAASSIGIEEGIILTSGQASSAVGPNSSDLTTTENGTAGDSDLNSLLIGSGLSSNDASILEFEFESEGGDLFFDFVFASEDYNEFANSNFIDVLGFFLDGENIALIPGTTTPVSTNNVNGGNPLGTNAQNARFYNNNDTNDGGPFFDIEYDGFTNVFTAQALGLSPGTHTIKLAVADVGDSRIDSAFFIAAKSFADVKDPVKTPESDSLLSLLAVGLVVSSSVFKCKMGSQK